MKNVPPNRTALIAEALRQEKRALTVQELEHALGIKAAKLRTSLTNYHHEIVRVGDNLYDLRARAYRGKQMRVRPSKEDLAKGRLSLYEDASMFLRGMLFKTQQPISLMGNGMTFSPGFHRPRQQPIDSYLDSMKLWYKETKFELGDEVIFTCKDIEKYVFTIERVPYRSRDKLLVTLANRMLTDAAHRALQREFGKYGMDMFMIRNYFYLIKPLTPPDPYFEVLACDPRFVNNYSERMVSSTGYVLDGDIPAHGLRKFYYQHQSNAHVPIEILTDYEYNERYGVCVLCEQRVIWELGCGWRHCYDDTEWVETEITKEFKKFEPTRETIAAFKKAGEKLPHCPEEPKKMRDKYKLR